MLSKMISKINEQENEVTTAEYMENKFIAESVLSELEINVMKQKRRQETKKKKKKYRLNDEKRKNGSKFKLILEKKGYKWERRIN